MNGFNTLSKVMRGGLVTVGFGALLIASMLYALIAQFGFTIFGAMPYAPHVAAAALVIAGLCGLIHWLFFGSDTNKA